MREKLKLLNRKTISQLFKYPIKFKKTIVKLTLISILGSVFSVLSAYIVKVLVDSAVEQDAKKLWAALIVTGIVLLVEIIINNLLSYYQSMEIIKEQSRLQRDIVSACYSKKWRAIKDFQTGDLLTYINSDTEIIIGFWLETFPSTLAMGVHFILAFGLLYTFDPMLAVVSFVIAPLFLLIGYPISRKLRNYQADVQESEGTLLSYITESIQNIDLIKIFNHREKSTKQLEAYQNTYIETIKKKSLYTLFTSIVLYIGYSIGNFLGLTYGAYRLATGGISFGTFSALLNLIAQVQEPLESIGKSIPQYIYSLASTDRLSQLIDLANDDEEESDVNENDGINKSTKSPSKTLENFKSISFSQISFGYSETHRIFHQFDFHIKKGDKIAIVGPSGSGKTSLSRLLLDFVSPTEGKIIIETEEEKTITLSAKTRSLFAYVPQDNVLFSGTIRDNLKFADEEASNERLIQVLKIACADEFITQLPDGLDTELGEEGHGFSEGQIQRICIARAILYDKPILILDEATSALDEETEQKIVSNLSQYQKDLTLLAITHRPSIKSICTSVLTL